VDDRDVSVSSDERLHAYLSGLTREQLVARLLALAERDEVALTALRAEEAAVSGAFDLAAFRKELTARIRISDLSTGAARPVTRSGCTVCSTCSTP
jgi:hypothetical protein